MSFLKLLSTTSICLLALGLHAQNASIQRCHTDEYTAEMSAQDPAYAAGLQAAKQQAIDFAQQNPNFMNERGGAVVIPTVVHVIHSGQAVGTGANISDAQIHSQMDVLNEDFRMMNPDASNTLAQFQSVAADVGIEFCLASIDPNGNPTTGINRVNMTFNNFDSQVKPATIWDRDKYLNMWVTDLGGGILGYATFPGGNSTRDGVVIGYEYVGRFPANPYSNSFNLGRTATHEVGHWLGQYHVWGDGGCGQDDGHGDTPQSDASNYGCQLSHVSCGSTDMVQNFMDYSDDDCFTLFTQDQATSMNAVLQTSRSSLLTSNSCQNLVAFSFSGQVVDAATNTGVADAKVLFESFSFEYEVTTDASGNFNIPNMFESDYDVYAGKWGYMTNQHLSNSTIDAGTASMVIPIENGTYYDDATLTFNWTVSGDATTGIWEKDEPVGTDNNGTQSNMDEDVTNDFSNKCFITGNGGGNAGTDDVDDGTTTLRSPTFDLALFKDPYISYSTWFYNGGGNGDPLDDQMRIIVYNGQTSSIIQAIDNGNTTMSTWVEQQFRLLDYIQLTSNMYVEVEISDLIFGNGHLVEGGLDRFRIQDSIGVGIQDVKAFDAISLYPNPAQSQLHLGFENPEGGKVQIRITNAVGQQVFVKEIEAVNSVRELIDLADFANGIYQVEILSDRRRSVRKFSKI